MEKLKSTKSAVIIVIWTSVIGYLFMISSSISHNYQDIENYFSKQNVEKIIVRDSSRNALAEWKEEWKAQLELRDANFEIYQHGLENDIATLEIMLTVLALVIGFFAYLGVHNFKETKESLKDTLKDSDEISAKFSVLTEKTEGQLSTLQEKISKELDFVTALKNEIGKIKQGIELDHSDLLKTMREINEFKVALKDSSAEFAVKREKLKAEVLENVKNHKHPSFFLPTLHYLYESDLIFVKEDSTQIEDLFLKGLYYYASENYSEAINFFKYVEEINENYKNICYYLALAFDDNLNFEKAIIYYHKCNTTSRENMIKSIMLIGNFASNHFHIAQW